MSKTRTMVYIGQETDSALREYARRNRLSIGEATDRLLQRALFGSLDEGMEAMLVPEIRRAVAEVTKREVRDQVTAMLDAQTSRLAGLIVTSGRDAYIARRLVRDALEELAGSDTYAREREEDAKLASRTRYTREGLRREENGAA